MEKDMTKGSPLPVILQFTLPLIIGNIFQQLYNMADTIIVGRYVGADALAAVGSTGTIMFLVLGFAQGITAGFTVLTSQRFGAKDTRGVKRSVANGILLALLFTVVLTFFSMISMRPLLHLMNTPENIFQDAYTYIMIICGGLIATIFYNLLSSYLRAVGNSQTCLLYTSNVGSNENRPVLIFRRIITQQIENLVPRLYVKACGRLVENQKLCFV